MCCSISFAGALLGFLYWNRNRARLFMGDSGSLFLGAILGGASLVPVFHAGASPIEPALVAVMVLVVPLFDTGFVLVLRRLAGRSATGAERTTCRIGWRRSAFPSEAPCGFCIWSASLAAAPPTC